MNELDTRAERFLESIRAEGEAACAAIRTETDSCAVAILDPRAAPGGRYHRAVLDALPAGIPITTNIEDIQTFLRARKSPDFFLPDFENDSKQSDSKTNTK